ncbi:hypothetical protein SERLA73DRAFT_132079 [Serpula lacrymans var. lacrymans S7.3]|uniref:Uncharacterized protein n=2 Tax=Serpula lacrymans var. lacrymans TaxID=341189 RepID=F8PQZ0_SERL3|nr:uncharacterized protein SERLADRAFT_460488 [Serpula lacrymans var. lacrymans S7.9]EGO01647.1 hypothetical protein SERLA73DRAFT_132079 [Serpula lacrymans var. lacrymans S7.3]EGO27298.1 hypothetical protein SERLADRAFT_460488 [Serpula lacrymans var. lacrymans S7.9]
MKSAATKETTRTQNTVTQLGSTDGTDVLTCSEEVSHGHRQAPPKHAISPSPTKLS